MKRYHLTFSLPSAPFVERERYDEGEVTEEKLLPHVRHSFNEIPGYETHREIHHRNGDITFETTDGWRIYARLIRE